MIVTEEETGKKYILQKNGETEKELVRQLSQVALDNNGGNIRKAAQEIGIARTTMSMRALNWHLKTEHDV